MQRTDRTPELNPREERAIRAHLRRQNDRATRGARRQIRRERDLMAQRAHLVVA